MTAHISFITIYLQAFQEEGAGKSFRFILLKKKFIRTTLKGDSVIHRGLG